MVIKLDISGRSKSGFILRDVKEIVTMDITNEVGSCIDTTFVSAVKAGVLTTDEYNSIIDYLIPIFDSLSLSKKYKTIYKYEGINVIVQVSAKA